MTLGIIFLSGFPITLWCIHAPLGASQFSFNIFQICIAMKFSAKAAWLLGGWQSSSFSNPAHTAAIFPFLFSTVAISSPCHSSFYLFFIKIFILLYCHNNLYISFSEFSVFLEFGWNPGFPFLLSLCSHGSAQCTSQLRDFFDLPPPLEAFLFALDGRTAFAGFKCMSNDLKSLQNGTYFIFLINCEVVKKNSAGFSISQTE